MQRFDVHLKIFGRAVYKVVEAEGGCLVKEANFEAEISLGSLLQPQRLQKRLYQIF